MDDRQTTVQAQHGDNEDSNQEQTSAKSRPRQRARGKTEDADDDPSKRRCVSTACIACRKRKSKCDGNLPSCAACSQVYGSECIYDPNSDHRRKGVYKNEVDDLKTRDSTVAKLFHAILNYDEEEAFSLVREIRSCDSLDAVAERLNPKEDGREIGTERTKPRILAAGTTAQPTFETHLYGKMEDLRLDDGSMRYIGGTSNLIYVEQEDNRAEQDEYTQQDNAVSSWTNVTDDVNLILHLLTMYFTWHYAYFTTLSKNLFYRDFSLGQQPSTAKRKTYYCSPLLLNAMCALGCHFTSHRGAREDAEDSATAGDHFFRECKRLLLENDEHERPRLTTVQALALMSVREAGCGREAKGWIYSGMSFRMSGDMGLNINTDQLSLSDEAEEDVRRITFWGLYLFDACWSNYCGRLPQLPLSIVTVPKFEVFPDEDAAEWSPYTDSGFVHAHTQPARTRSVARKILELCDISKALMSSFYNPRDMDKTRSKSAELTMLSGLQVRLENWRRDLPKELEPREGALSSVLTMHMFFQLLFIHLFRPFLKYTAATSPLPRTVSPRKLCTAAAATISKLMRLYKRSYGLRQICNIAVYIIHSACTIHLLNLPDRNAKRDIVHGVKHLEEIAESWLCARRTLAMLAMLARKWNIELPDEAIVVVARTNKKFGTYQKDLPVVKTEQSSPATALMPHQLEGRLDRQEALATPTASAFSPFVSAPYSDSAAAQFQAGNTVATTIDNSYQTSPPKSGSGVSYHNAPAASHHQQAWSSSNFPSRNITSPTDMFGGVHQLLRDSQEWVYKDQAQLATGFENWTGMDMNFPNWQRPTAQNDSAEIARMPVSKMDSTSAYGATQSGVGTAYPVADWMNQMAYNEEEWYQ